MISGYQVVLDACVLVNAALPRYAAAPRGVRRIFICPAGRGTSCLETKRTLETRPGLSPEQTAHLFDELGIHFADAWVEGYETLIPAMTNHPKDRHVLAAAIRCERPDNRHVQSEGFFPRARLRRGMSRHKARMIS